MEDKETKKLPVYAFDENDYLVEVKEAVGDLNQDKGVKDD